MALPQAAVPGGESGEPPASKGSPNSDDAARRRPARDAGSTGSTAETSMAIRPALEDEDSSQTSTTDAGEALHATRQMRARFEPGAAIGHYEVIRPLGRGGMGDVYLARDTRLGRLVALKFLLTVDPQRSARFLTEARATAQLSHENIVALHDIAEHEGLPYMVLEYVQGKTLATWFSERVRIDGRRVGLPAGRVAELMLPVARALVCAHEAGVVHRDLKPANLMLADSGAVKVLDFGVAKLFDDTQSGADEADANAAEEPEKPPLRAPSATAPLTQAGVMVGTQVFMAPEQWRGETVDGRTDVWAVGIMLYDLLVGEHPLAPLSAASLKSVPQMDLPMPSVRERLPNVGRLGVVVDRCLLKHKADRLGSARELCEELEAVARPGMGAARGEPEAANPYTGLLSFQERDAARFFGRERTIEQVVLRLSDQPLLTIVGSSGAGKSSLVRAGVIPALKRSGDAWEAFVIRPGPHPLAALAELLQQHSWQRSSQTLDVESIERSSDASLSSSERDALVARLRREPGFLGVQMRDRARRRRERALLFVDQFEEVVTLVAEEERAAFLACLAGAADDASSPLRVIVSVRQDFLDRVTSAYAPLSELMGQGTVVVGPLSRSGLVSALVRPVEALSYRFESEALVTQMLDAIEQTTGALPLLQFTAARLWEGRDQERRLLTEASYRAFGGVSGALATHADSVLGGMSNAERKWARVLLLRLVTPERTRAIVTRRELSELGSGTAAELSRVLGRLIDARLLTVEGAGRDESTVELVHESLIETWPALARWLEEEQENAQFRARLRGAAKEWEASGGAEGLLWRGEAADEARRWQKRQGQEAATELHAREARYLAALVALDERERRWRRQVVGALFAGLCLVVLLVSTLAVRSKQAAARAETERAEAQAQRAAAERSAARARNATRMAAARERQTDPTTVLALLREIEPGSTVPGWAELARWARDSGVARRALLHDDEVRSAAYHPDGRRIVCASSDKTVRVWNADGSGEPLVLRGHDDAVTSASFSPDGKRIVSSSEDKTVRVWNADGEGQPMVLRGHDGHVMSAAFSPDGKRIVSSSEDTTVRVWNADGAGQPLVFRGHGGRVAGASWSPDGQRIASASFDRTVRVWNADGSGQPLVLRGHDAQVTWVTFSPDGQRIASASFDKTARVWNADGAGQPLVLRGHDAHVYAAVWAPDGQRIATSSEDRTVRVWNADGSGQPLVLRGHGARVFRVAFGPDGQRIVSASYDKTARIWSADSTGQFLVLRGHDAHVYGAAFSPDGRRIASASEDKTVRVWNADGAGQPLVLRGHDGRVYAAVWSPDGKRIVSASGDTTVRVWNADGAGQPLVLRGHDGRVFAASFSPDGRRIVSSSEDRTVRVWSADGSGQPLVLRGHNEVVYQAAWSPDGQRIVSASYDKTVRVWNADGAGQPLVLRGHDRFVFGAAFSPDGRRIVSASEDKTVRVWNADGTGQPLVLRGHETSVTVHGDRAFSPDGARFVGTSEDATVRVWNADGTGEPLVLRASNAPVDTASWSADGRRIVGASGDKTVIVWSDLEPFEDSDDPRLWTATSYCMPLDVRERLLNFSEEQARADLERCQRGVTFRRGATEMGR